MTEPAAATASRWRMFADCVALTLGLNLWLSMVLLPSVFVGAWQDATTLAATALPVVVLAAGLWRRSDAALLLGFPSALLVPTALSPAIIRGPVYDATRFFVVAAGLVAYMFAAAYLSSLREPPAPAHTRPLASSHAPPPPRWRRRFRVYTALTVLSAVFPLVLLHRASFHAPNRAFVRALFPGKVEAFTCLLDLGVLALWLALFMWVFMGILRPHRVGDRALAGELSALRAHIRRGRPGPAFYLGVGTALLLMTALLILRYYRGG